MFKNTFQSGFLSILYSLGSKPLQIWDKEVATHEIGRHFDSHRFHSLSSLSGTKRTHQTNHRQRHPVARTRNNGHERQVRRKNDKTKSVAMATLCYIFFSARRSSLVRRVRPRNIVFSCRAKTRRSTSIGR